MLFILVKALEPCRCCVDVVMGVFDDESKVKKELGRLDALEVDYDREQGIKYFIISVIRNATKEGGW